MSRRTVSSAAEATFPALLSEADKICFKSAKNFRDESNLQDLLQYSLQKRMWELASTLCLLTVPSNSGNSSWDSAFEHDSKGWWEDPGPVTKPLVGLNWCYLLQQGHGLTQTEVLQLAREASSGQRLQHKLPPAQGRASAGTGAHEEQRCSKNHALLQLMTQIYSGC